MYSVCLLKLSFSLRAFFFLHTMKQTETPRKGVNSDIAVLLGSNYDVNERLILHERAA